MEAGIVEIFFSFVSEESKFYKQIRRQLRQLERDGRIRCWSREEISAGEEPEGAIQERLARATVIVLLVSPAYVESDEHYQESRKAMERRQEGKAHVLPVLLKPGLDDYKNTPFGKLEPAHEKPITLWSNQDEAFKAVAESIRQVALQKQQPEASKNQGQPWDLPYPRNPLFTGREAELQAIADALRGGQNAAIGQAISGLGGIGKTQTALEYAYRHRDEYRYIFWAIADTRDTLNTAYSRLAEQLDLPGKSLTEQRLIVEAVKSWLAAHNGWLLILDNADDLAIVPDYLPATIPGHLLLATRARALGHLAQRVEIKRLDADEGSRFLLRRSGLLGRDQPLERADPNDLTTAREIVSELAGLPLALDQAGAYIEETSCGLLAYLDLYRAHHAELLRLCAFLAPDDIPELIITEGAAELTQPLQTLASSPLKLNAAIAELQKYSLIERTPAKQTLSVHRLVQLALRDTMPPDIERAWAERTVRVLELLFPWPEVDTWETCRQLLPHGQAGAALIEQWQMELIEGAWLLHNVGSYLDDRGEYHEAQLYYEKAVAIKRKVLGEENLNTLASMNNLALVYRHQGKYDDALALHQQELAIRRKVLGEQHPDTASSLEGLALVEEALSLFEKALAIWQKRLGPEHPDTKTAQSNYEETLRLMEEKEQGGRDG